MMHEKRKYTLIKALTYIGGKLYKVPQPRILILCYHSVHPERSFRSCHPHMFDRHLQWLKAHCDVIPLRDLLHIQFQSVSISKPQVIITFDDGHIDNYEYAFPLLLKWGIPATFFLTAGLLEQDPEVMQRFQRLRHTSREELEPLTWRQVREMIAAGMECGAHTYTHPNLLFLQKPQLVYEIKQVKAYIEDKIGQRVDGFAYPFGKPHCHFNRVHIDMAQEAGYKYAVAVFYRGILPRDSLWVLPRISINNNENVKILADKIEGRGIGWDTFMKGLPAG